MEDRRCRKVMELFLTTVIILSVSVHNVYAAPEKSTEKFYNRVLELKETILNKANENQYFKLIIKKISGDKENNISFVIESVPLEKAIEKVKISIIKDTKTNTDTNKADNLTERSAVKTESVSRSSETQAVQGDVDLLARIIYAEARGESFEGQVAVGAVVLNRLADPEFPKTIWGVVYQKGQFTAVSDKQINLTPDGNAYKAAMAALEGEDPSNGAIFYYNPKIATDDWIKTRSVVKSIGNHYFCV